MILQRQQGEKWIGNRWIRRFNHLTSKVVECWIILVELILTVAWWINRDFQYRKRTLDNSQTLWNFKAGKSTSRLKYVRKQPILRWLCTGSKKLRLQSQLTNLWHRDRLWSELISLTSICLMRWLRLPWKKGSQHAHSLPKNSKCRRAACSEVTTYSYEEDKLRTWSMSISVQPELMKQYKDSQTCSL